MRLNEYLTHCGSDKDTVHNYGLFYNMLWSYYEVPQRGASIMEIGVSLFGDGSFRAFGDFNQRGKVVGVDVQPYQGWLSDNMEFILANAYSHEFVDNHKGRYDIIIDDGSHTWEDQLFFLEHYRKLLTSDGILICEDIHQSNLTKLIEYARNTKGMQVYDLRFPHSPNNDDIIAVWEV